MSFTDDLLLSVAKELYLAKTQQKPATIKPLNDTDYTGQFERIAEEFSSFVLLLRRKLKVDDQS